MLSARLTRGVLGARAVLATGYGYFCRWRGEADWLDRTVRVPTLSSLNLEVCWSDCFRCRR
jgi:hypothetical protein